jgi:hypothetical protein
MKFNEPVDLGYDFNNRNREIEEEYIDGECIVFVVRTAGKLVCNEVLCNTNPYFELALYYPKDEIYNAKIIAVNLYKSYGCLEVVCFDNLGFEMLCIDMY